MDDRRFDALVRQLASGQSRRSVLKGLLGLGGVALAGRVATESADGARRPTPTPKPVKCPGTQHWDGTKCVCGSGTTCGPDCCTGSAVCCDNACCNGECYGEELCCPTGRVVCDGECCPSNSQCCTVGGSSFCAPADVTCCAGDGDCAALDYCDGTLAHHFTCVNSICTDSVQNCQGTDVCSTYTCTAGVCGTAPIAGCCESSTTCQAVDACTPAQCLDNHTCNAVSNCTSEEHCCNGTCASNLDECCTVDTVERDCPPAFCSDLGSEAYSYTCVDFVCTRQTQDCLGDDACTSYGCSEGVCTAVSRCASGEFCCDDESCSVGGLCGCTIDGEYFPPCVDGCPDCVTPNGGSTPCGCAQVTGQRCESTELCLDALGEGICAGPPDSSVCVIPATPAG